ncbi:MOSC domain-containing protein [Oceanospirillum sediminis]|uniref:MOSC domain-containing protein n=1 Tax=Oceanospirillum sediminis TaxID=2760088 RepID=A0A839IWP8_9GAMM|nr:MOSC domain-containing protein [Oceanospirillum sediminis]MBB1489120.1 MOSC domain-containing protein [Oceanospirillum sediminis]
MTQKQLLGRYLDDINPGRLDWIGLRPGRKQPMITTESVMALAELGLEGDHRCEKTPGSGRQVTLIAAESIRTIEIYSGHQHISPDQLRRNLVISGININLLRHQRFRIGDAVFEATALCHPCSRMNQTIGPGGAAAMFGYGGLCARIIQSGLISTGDQVIPLTDES